MYVDIYIGGDQYHDRCIYIYKYTYTHTCANMPNMARVGTLCAYMSLPGRMWTHMADMAHAAC